MIISLSSHCIVQRQGSRQNKNKALTVGRGWDPLATPSGAVKEKTSADGDEGGGRDHKAVDGSRISFPGKAHHQICTVGSCQCSLDGFKARACG